MAFYGTLGVPSDARGDEIRRAYKRRALQLHPDKNLAQETSETFAEVNEAYEVLSQPRRREIYDAFGKEGLRLYEGAYEIARASRATGTVLPPIMLVAALATATTAIAVLLAAFVGLAALRLDGQLDAVPWPLLFLPLWLADPFLLLVGALVTAEAPGQLWPAVLQLLPPSVPWGTGVSAWSACCLTPLQSVIWQPLHGSTISLNVFESQEELHLFKLELSYG